MVESDKVIKKFELKDNDENIKATLENDVINNKEYLGCLIRLLENIEENEIVCIDGKWGSGKTFLVKQLIYLIENYSDTCNLHIVDNVKESLENVATNNLIFIL